MASFVWPPSLGGANGVSSLNTLTGDITLAAGTGITITPSGNTLTIAATSGSAITALTGDGTATGPGSVALTLATVNSNVGSFGTATGVGTFTVNGKGLVTAASTTAIQITESQVTNLVSDLAGKQASGNYITALTGDATASGPGSAALTLATVNSNIGSFTNASITVNGKGLVTAASSGTAPVTSVSVATANGLAGSSSGGATPALTLSTTITGILQGNGTAISAATTTGSGSVVLATAPTLSNPIVGTQSQGDGSTKAASTSYVDVAIANAVAGVNPAVAVQAATTAASDTSGFTYNNGASGIGATFTGTANTAVTIDGYTFTALGQRLLVKNDTQSPSGAFNGCYYVTQVQTGILPPVFTRTLDYDQPSDMNNTGAIPVINGTVNGTTQWVLTSLVITVGTTPLTFAQFSKNPASYLLVANNLSDVASKTTSFNNLSPMTTGGDVIYGGASGAGTRLANGSSGQVLTSGGGTAAPTWTTIGSVGATTLDGTYVPLASPWGTCTNISVWYKIVGDEMHCRGTWKTGTDGASTAAIQLPASKLIDTTKMTATANVQQVGFASAMQNTNRATFSATNANFVLFYDGSTNDRVFLCAGASARQFDKFNAGTNFSNNDVLTFDFWVPIQ